MTFLDKASAALTCSHVSHKVMTLDKASAASHCSSTAFPVLIFPVCYLCTGSRLQSVSCVVVHYQHLHSRLPYIICILWSELFHVTRIYNMYRGLMYVCESHCLHPCLFVWVFVFCCCCFWSSTTFVFDFRVSRQSV